MEVILKMSKDSEMVELWDDKQKSLFCVFHLDLLYGHRNLSEPLRRGDNIAVTWERS